MVMVLLYLSTSCINLERLFCSTKSMALPNFLIANLEFIFKKVKCLKIVTCRFAKEMSVLQIIEDHNNDENDYEDLSVTKKKELLAVVADSDKERKLACTVSQEKNWIEISLGLQQLMFLKSPASGCGSVDAYQTENIVNTGEEDEDSTGTIVKF